jgi:hypothetical protein
VSTQTRRRPLVGRNGEARIRVRRELTAAWYRQLSYDYDGPRSYGKAGNMHRLYEEKVSLPVGRRRPRKSPNQDDHPGLTELGL